MVRNFLRKLAVLLASLVVAFADVQTGRADYIGSATTTSPTTSIQSTATEILGAGGGSGSFTYKGGGNAVDAAVATALAACVVNPGNASLGGYGGHMLIYKSGFDGDPPLVTCIDFNSAAGSLATSNMFSANPTNGHVTGTANQTGWKACGVPGTLAGLVVAQTNYGRKMDGTNYFTFSEIIEPALARIANGQATGNGYYTLASVSNLVYELYTNANPYGAFYAGDIALDIVSNMQAYGGLVTYADMTNYRPREVTPYSRHFSCPNGTAGTVYVAPPGSAGVSVLQHIALIDALGWTNGPNGTWDSLKYWHSRAEALRLIWKDHWQLVGDPWAGVLPLDFLGNGSTNFADQLLAHVTNSYPFGCPWDTNEIRLTNSLFTLVTNAVEHQTNNPISVDWDDIRYGTRNITISDKWGNCVAMTFSMGGGYGAQVGVTNRGIIFGQGMALFDARPGWPNSVGPGKRSVNNMSPALVVPDFPGSPTNGAVGGRPPLAIGAAGGSTIENNVAMELIKYLSESPSSSVSDPPMWLHNFEANNIIYFRNGYPTGVQSYLTNAGYSAPGNPPSAGEVTYVQAWVPPEIATQPASTNANTGGTVSFAVTATGVPLFYQWLSNGVALADGGNVSGSKTPQLTLTSVSNSALYTVVITNGALSVTSAPAALSVAGAPVIAVQPVSRTNVAGTLATFSVSAAGAAPLSYQWLKNTAALSNGGNVSGATTSVLSLNSVSSSDVASYSVIVSNTVGATTSIVATLTIATAPMIVTQPSSRTNFPGTLATFSVTATGTAPLSYQWLKNSAPLTDGGNIFGATASALNVSSVMPGDAGTYSVVVTNAAGAVTSLGATLTVNSNSSYLSLLWSVGSSDGKPWMNFISSATAVPNQRTIAYNALSNHLYVITRSSNTTSNYVVYVLNATNGTLLYTLKTNGIQCNVGKGGIGLDGIAVADDGAIYACNEAPDAEGIGGTDPTSYFRVYRWADANSNTSPSLIFSGDPSACTSALRWGDNLTVRGAGTNTQILMDMTFFGITPGTTNGFAAVLSPSNQFMTNFVARWFTTTNYAAGVGRSIEFDSANNALWQKEAGKALHRITFNPAASLGGTQISSTNVLVASNFTAALMGVGLDLTRNLAAGVVSNSSTTADSLNLYDIGDLNSPSLLAQYDFPITPRLANGNRITQTFFKSDLLFSIDANNGIMVFRVQTPVTTLTGTVKLTSFARLPNGAFEFSYSNSDGRAYTVFASTNLMDWTSIGTATQTAPGAFQFTDSSTTNINQRFYQLRSP